MVDISLIYIIIYFYIYIYIIISQYSIVAISIESNYQILQIQQLQQLQIQQLLDSNSIQYFYNQLLWFNQQHHFRAPGLRAHRFRPCVTAFQAAVPNGSVCTSGKRRKMTEKSRGFTDKKQVLHGFTGTKKYIWVLLTKMTVLQRESISFTDKKIHKVGLVE